MEPSSKIEKEVTSPESFTVDRKEVCFDGAKSLITVVRSTPGSEFYFKYDDDLRTVGINTEANGLLIDQAKTAEKLGHPAGYQPEGYLEGVDDGLAIMTGHFGWQSGAFMIEDGNLTLLKNDEGKLVGNFSMLVEKDGQWHFDTVGINKGKLLDSNIEKVAGSYGFNGPQIVRNGEAVPVGEIMSDPRIVADPRNVFDLSAGRDVDPSFFQDIRKVAISNMALRGLAKGALVTMNVPYDKETYDAHHRVMSEAKSHGLPLKANFDGNNYRYAITEKLPTQKMPIMGYGCDKDGNLVIVAVDGRQPGSAGVSIDQLSELMVGEGIIDGILGGGGGDVAVVKKDHSGIEILNSPSNVDKAGQRVTRRVPNVMIIR